MRYDTWRRRAERQTPQRAQRDSVKRRVRAWQRPHNPQCCGARCVRTTGEVRIMPLGGDGNLILCRTCWEHENDYRRQRGRETGAPERWPVVDWDTARVYEEAP